MEGLPFALVRDLIVPHVLRLEDVGGSTARLEKAALTLQLVSKQWRKLVVESRAVWHSMFNARWPKQNKALKVRSWFRIYQRRRVSELSPAGCDAVVFIENCAMVEECPMRYYDLKPASPIGADTERWCDKCQRTVHRTDSVATLRALSQRGECVSFHVVRPKVLQPPAQAAHYERTGCFVL